MWPIGDARRHQPLQRNDTPVRGYQADPFDPRLLHRYVRVQPLRNRLCDDRLPLLPEQLDEALLLGDEGVGGGGLAVEEGSNPPLLVGRGNRQHYVFECLETESWSPLSDGRADHVDEVVPRHDSEAPSEEVVAESWLEWLENGIFGRALAGRVGNSNRTGERVHAMNDQVSAPHVLVSKLLKCNHESVGTAILPKRDLSVAEDRNNAISRLRW